MVELTDSQSGTDEDSNAVRKGIYMLSLSIYTPPLGILSSSTHSYVFELAHNRAKRLSRVCHRTKKARADRTAVVKIDSGST